MVVGVVVGTDMGEVEVEAVEGVKVMEQEEVGEGQRMEVRKVTLQQQPISLSQVQGALEDGTIGYIGAVLGFERATA